MPKISIIVPVYRVEQYLDRCVNSIMNQTFSNFELILVDDESPDQCPQMCDGWASKDPRIKVIHKQNGGLSSARNAGLACATGQYICFVDSDDWITENALAYMYGLIEHYKADFVCTTLLRTKTEKHYYAKKQKKCEEVCLSQEQFLKILFKIGTQENVQYACGKLFRAELFSDVQFPEGVIAEDVPTIFRVAIRSKRIVYSQHPVYMYFYNVDSITTRKFSKKRFDLITVWKMIVETAESYCDEQTQEYARLNLCRAYFGLLCNINLEKINPEDIMVVREKEKELVKIVKLCRKKLVSAQMPLSRKVLLNGFCFCYPLTAIMMRAGGTLQRSLRI